jgi:hypothetical protein
MERSALNDLNKLLARKADGDRKVEDVYGAHVISPRWR